MIHVQSLLSTPLGAGHENTPRPLLQQYLQRAGDMKRQHEVNTPPTYPHPLLFHMKALSTLLFFIFKVRILLRLGTHYRAVCKRLGTRLYEVEMLAFNFLMMLEIRRLERGGCGLAGSVKGAIYIDGQFHQPLAL
jgi:hypothetical protein